jgi:hypothetical protein
MLQAFPDTLPRDVGRLHFAFPNRATVAPFSIRDRDLAFAAVGATTGAMDVNEVLTASRSPWQNGVIERFIGSVRRECLDHVIIFSAAGLQRIMKRYVEYYERSRTHLALDKDAPISRAISPSTDGLIVSVPQLGGLHHRYERIAA